MGGWDLALGLGPGQALGQIRQPACGSQQNFAKNRASRPDFLQNSAVHHFFVALADENRPGPPWPAFVGPKNRGALFLGARKKLGIDVGQKSAERSQKK